MSRSLFPTGTLAPLALLALCLGALGACASPVPTVEILEASPSMLAASDDGNDDLTIAVRYTDGDGDLGRGSAKVFDCRAEGLVTELAIPRIANDEAVEKGVPIEGQLELVVADIGAVEAAAEAPPTCADLGASAPQEGAQVFCVVLVDAADNESEGACTGPIHVEP